MCPHLSVQAQAEIQMQAQQALAERMIKLCFTRCVTSPDGQLSGKQSRCLDQCTSSFMEGFQVAADTLASLAKKQAASQTHE
jgi:ferredoxin-like protein FixX